MSCLRIHENKTLQTCNDILQNNTGLTSYDIDVNHNYFFHRNHTIFHTFVIQFANLDMLEHKSSLHELYENNFP